MLPAANSVAPVRFVDERSRFACFFCSSTKNVSKTCPVNRFNWRSITLAIEPHYLHRA